MDMFRFLYIFGLLNPLLPSSYTHSFSHLDSPVLSPLSSDGDVRLRRYTCANAVSNGTWWVGTYGLAVGDASCEAGTGVLQFCEMGCVSASQPQPTSKLLSQPIGCTL